MKNWVLLSCCLFAGCVTSEPELTSVAQGLGCDGRESYIDENGEEVICVYTDEDYTPPDDDPWDWCTSFPEMCQGDGDEPPPPPPPDPGGDPGDAGLCSIYNGQVSGESAATARSTVIVSEGETAYQQAYERAAAEGRRTAGAQATSVAESECRGRVRPAGVGVCKSRSAGFAGSTDLGCYWSGAEYPQNTNTVVLATCRARSSVDCVFEWSLY